MNASLDDTSTAIQWAPVVGFVGLYAVSNTGEVKSLSRVVNGRKRQTVGERILRQMNNGKGYKTVRLWRHGSERSVYVHRMVLTAFVGPAPIGLEGCHNDGNRANNAVENLRWDTKKNNHADKVRHGTVGNGEKAHAAKLTVDEVLAIRHHLSCGAEQETVAQMFGVTQPTISDIVRHRTWKHI